MTYVNAISRLEALDYDKVAFAEVKNAISDILVGYLKREIVVNSSSATCVFRGQINDGQAPFETTGRIWYPPTSRISRMGRLNDVSEAVLYCSISPNVCIFECRPKIGDILTIAEISVTQNLFVMTAGMEMAVPSGMMFPSTLIEGFSKEFQEVLGKHHDIDKWKAINGYLCKVMTQDIPDQYNNRYKPSVAVSKVFFANEKCDAILFPSVMSGLQNYNLCVRPSSADTKLSVVKLHMLEICGEEQSRSFNVRHLLWSSQIDANGSIKWETPPAGSLSQFFEPI